MPQMQQILAMTRSQNETSERAARNADQRADQDDFSRTLADQATANKLAERRSDRAANQRSADSAAPAARPDKTSASATKQEKSVKNEAKNQAKNETNNKATSRADDRNGEQSAVDKATEGKSAKAKDDAEVTAQNGNDSRANADDSDAAVTEADADAESEKLAATSAGSEEWLALLEQMQQQLLGSDSDADPGTAEDAAEMSEFAEQLLAKLPADVQSEMRQLFASVDIDKLAEGFSQLMAELELQPDSSLDELAKHLQEKLSLTPQQAEAAIDTLAALMAVNQSTNKAGEGSTAEVAGARNQLLLDLAESKPSVASLKTSMQALQQVLVAQEQASTANSETTNKAALAAGEGKLPLAASAVQATIASQAEQNAYRNAAQTAQTAAANAANAASAGKPATDGQTMNIAPQAVTESELRQKLAEEFGLRTGQSSVEPAAAKELTADARSLIQAAQAVREPAAVTGKSALAPQTFGEAMRQAQQTFELNQAQAPQQLRERLMLMSANGIQRAEIRLDPPDLGTLNIRITVQQDQAHVNFQAQTPQAREMIEQAMPRLRELMEQQGLQLADSEVSQQQQGSGDDQQQQFGQGGEAEQAELDWTAEVALQNGEPLAPGRVDFYA